MEKPKYIRELYRGNALDDAFASPKLDPRKSPDLATASKIVFETLRNGVIEYIASEILIDLLDGIVLFEVQNGDYADAHDADEYESAIDDVVERVFEKYQNVLSASWLGENCVDSGVWRDPTDKGPEGRTITKALALSAAKDAWKEITHDLTPAKVLANADITERDIQARLAQNEEKEPEMSDVATIITKMHNHLGAGFDQMTVYEDLTMLLEEDDEILANGAAARLGLSETDVGTLGLALLETDGDLAQQIVDAVAEGATAAPPKPAASKPAPPATGGDEGDEDLDPEVFIGLKECGVKDTDFASALGVSRSTYTNWFKGKTKCRPNEEQRALLRAELVNRANMMLKGLSLLDGTDQMQVT